MTRVKMTVPDRRRGKHMTDIIMVGILIVSFVIVKFFMDWCQRQIESRK